MIYFLKLVARIPESFLYVFSDFLSFLLFYIVRYRRKTVEKNIGLVFPDKSSKDHCLLARQYYRHLADVVVETLMLSRMSHDELRDRVEIVGVGHLEKYKADGQSVILLSAHQGNWEWMLTAISQAIPFPLDALYRPLHDPVMERFFMDLRQRFGANMIPADKAARIILKLRREARAFGILGDQNPRRRDEKYWVTFMGIETPVVIGPERIAKLTGYPLFYVATEKVTRGRYRCVITPLAAAPYMGDGEISQLYMDAMQAHILRQPECWMWSHHRWRYRRQDCPMSLGGSAPG